MTSTKPSDKRYTDSSGNECSLDTMCRREPEWAAHRMRWMIDRIAELEHLLAAERIAGGAGRGAFEAAVRGQARAEERLAKIEAACEWLVAHQDERDRVRITKWFIERSRLDRYDYRKTETEKHNGTGPSIINALIALHERAGK